MSQQSEDVNNSNNRGKSDIQINVQPDKKPPPPIDTDSRRPSVRSGLLTFDIPIRILSATTAQSPLSRSTIPSVESGINENQEKVPQPIKGKSTSKVDLLPQPTGSGRIIPKVFSETSSRRSSGRSTPKSISRRSSGRSTPKSISQHSETSSTQVEFQSPRADFVWFHYGMNERWLMNIGCRKWTFMKFLAQKLEQAAYSATTSYLAQCRWERSINAVVERIREDNFAKGLRPVAAQRRRASIPDELPLQPPLEGMCLVDGSGNIYPVNDKKDDDWMDEDGEDCPALVGRETYVLCSFIKDEAGYIQDYEVYLKDFTHHYPNMVHALEKPTGQKKPYRRRNSRRGSSLTREYDKNKLFPDGSRHSKQSESTILDSNIARPPMKPKPKRKSLANPKGWRTLKSSMVITKALGSKQ